MQNDDIDGDESSPQSAGYTELLLKLNKNYRVYSVQLARTWNKFCTCEMALQFLHRPPQVKIHKYLKISMSS